ncbi:MAG: DUF3109 family protein [Saprospiraceae bacterium]|nr:DUF3109 family protein [Saprospiraceae bacterium]
MLLIDDILVSDALIEEQFVCNLNACKGACCWEGDWGAPLEKKEIQILERIYPDIKPFLDSAGIQVIEEKGLSVYYEEAESEGTPLLENGACAYLTYDQNGTAKCGIERAWEAGKTDFKKPISCHLYPVRVKEKKQSMGFEALNYDRWDICSAACELGKSLQVPVYRFVKDAIIRKYGRSFYDQLDAAAEEYYKR